MAKIAKVSKPTKVKVKTKAKKPAKRAVKARGVKRAGPARRKATKAKRKAR